MAETNWAEVEALFQQALCCAPEARFAFVAQRCAGDNALRDEVLTLLHHHDSSGSFIDQPLALGSFDAADRGRISVEGRAFCAGDQLGAYTILEQLGQGGMGVVYAAKQASPSRTVALKVIRPQLASPELLRRFELEAQVLGRLQHAGIAQIYEAGTLQTESGRYPYFAMELVQGRPLLDYAAAAQLTTPQRLELIARVCEAVQYAHQRGVIHRDLKPANILVVAEEGSRFRVQGSGSTQAHQSEIGHHQSAMPKILDFGVARLTDADSSGATLALDMPAAERPRREAAGGQGPQACQGLATRAGELVGTLPYMSPEQVTGDPNLVDTRCDVYALGVILYELLTGRLPHDLRGRSLPEAARIIAQDDPIPPHTQTRDLRGDVEAIVLKAIEKDRARRYASVSELLADIGRYLRDEPILARPASTIYQLRKFARRNRALVAGGGVALTALVVGAIATGWQAVRATHERNRAVRSEQIAQVRLTERDAEASKARAINDFLTDMLRAGDPLTAAGSDLTVRQMLDRAAARIGTALPAQPQVEAALRHTLTEAYWNLARYAEAEAQARAAIAALRAAGQADGAAELAARSLLAAALREQGRSAEAERLFKETLEASRRTLGHDHELSLQTLRGLARTFMRTGRPAEAEPLFREAVDTSRRVFGDAHITTARALADLATVVHERGNAQAAEELFDQAERLLSKLLSPEHPETIGIRAIRASCLRDQGRLPEAEALLRATIEAQRRVLGDDHRATIGNMANLAAVLLDQGHVEASEPMLREAAERMGRTLGPAHPDRLVTLNNRAVALRRLSRLEEADALYVELLELMPRTLGPRHAHTFAVMVNRAAVLVDLGRPQEALALYREAHDGLRSTLGEEHPMTRAAAEGLAPLAEPVGQAPSAPHDVSPSERESLHHRPRRRGVRRAAAQSVAGHGHSATAAPMNAWIVLMPLSNWISRNRSCVFTGLAPMLGLML